MARPREFDIDAAVDRAMHVFWTHGYEATTTDELLKGMGLTRGSLYKAFGDKLSLFLKSLDLYDQREVDGAVAHLVRPDLSGKDRITSLFNDIVAKVEAGDRLGCLLCSTLAEAPVQDPEISARTASSVKKLHDAFARALEDNPETTYPDSYAQLLLTQYVGIRMLSRTSLPASTIRDSANAVEALLGNKGA